MTGWRKGRQSRRKVEDGEKGNTNITKNGLKNIFSPSVIIKNLFCFPAAECRRRDGHMWCETQNYRKIERRRKEAEM